MASSPEHLTAMGVELKSTRLSWPSIIGLVLVIAALIADPHARANAWTMYLLHSSGCQITPVQLRKGSSVPS